MELHQLRYFCAVALGVDDFTLQRVEPCERCLDSWSYSRLRRPGACQCPIRNSRNFTRNSSYLCFQVLAAFAHAFVNVALHSRTVNFEQLITAVASLWPKLKGVPYWTEKLSPRG
jgi:hypothetical protein